MAGEALPAIPVVVKGVLRGDDAKLCVDCGVKGIMVSNHGGRQLDTTVTTAEVMPEIIEAVGNSPPRSMSTAASGAAAIS